MLFSMAILPAIALLIYIYTKDKREKESFPLLINCFTFGLMIVLPVLGLEKIIMIINNMLFARESVIYIFVKAFFVAAFSEEIFKYIALNLRTWKSGEYNCSFDGIVYSVFVSLGFASLENVLFVIKSGFTVAVVRMFSAVPIHACTAVFMGYYYSKAKKASILGERKMMLKYRALAVAIPLAAHGIYDFLQGMVNEAHGDSMKMLVKSLWVICTVAEFALAFISVNKASKSDEYLVAKLRDE